MPRRASRCPGGSGSMRGSRYCRRRVVSRSRGSASGGCRCCRGSRSPRPAPLPVALQPTVDLIAENCEPALCTVLFMGGAGGSLRSGVTQNPVRLTRSVQAGRTRVTVGGVPAYVWPGGGITIMADVRDMPDNAFGYVPTPAIVAPLEFTVSREEYRALGGHDGAVRSVRDVLERGGEYGAEVRAVAPKP